MTDERREAIEARLVWVVARYDDGPGGDADYSGHDDAVRALVAVARAAVALRVATRNYADVATDARWQRVRDAEDVLDAAIDALAALDVGA